MAYSFLRAHLAWACAGLLAAACTSNPSASLDECQLGGDCGPCDPSEPGSSCPTGTSGTQTGDSPNFDAGHTSQEPQAEADLPCDVFAVLETHCHTCHGDSLQFGAPMKLTRASHFQGAGLSDPSVPLADMIEQRVTDEQRPMPPQPNPLLSEEEITTLTAWLDAGAPAAAENEACGIQPSPDPPVDEDGGTAMVDEAGEPVFVRPEEAPDDCESFFELRAHGGDGEDDTTPYEVPLEPLDSGNQYMCFYFAPPYEDDSQGLWFSSILDDTRVLHHWLLYGTDAAVNAPGTSGACSAAEPGAYLLAGWAPGADDVELPADVGLQMPSGRAAGLILEVHYFNTDRLVAKDRSGVRLCTAPNDTREHTAGVHFLGSEGICIPPQSEHDVTDSNCNPRDDMGDIHIVNAWPHMHTLGSHMKSVIHRAGGGTEVLHDAPFDFNNQFNYPKDDIVIHAGDTLTTTCSFRNDTDQNVHFGDRTQDEMCYLFVTAWPVGALALSPADLLLNPLYGIGSFIQPARRCMDLTSIFGSCNGLADYPTSF